MPLTDTAIRSTKATAKPIKIRDGGGLYLLINSNGSRWWRLDYRFGGKRKTLSMGIYPDVPLAKARERREEARKLLADGIDPGENRKAIKAARGELAANSFEVVTREWLEGRKSHVEPDQHKKTLARLENDVFPWIGKRPIAEIDAPEILTVLKRIDSRGARYTAHRVRSEISRAFRFAIATGRAKGDPAQALIGAIPPAVERHFAAITEPAKVAEMLRAFDGFSGTFPVQCAMKLAPLTFVRPGELRKAEWKDIDLEKAEWRYRVSKTNTDHLVPLASQVVAIMRQLHQLTGTGRYVFPGGRTAAC